MNRFKSLLWALFFAALVPSVQAQSVVNMINGDSIVLDACALGGGTIYDDGGANGNYSNNFNGVVCIMGSAGMTITVTGSYNTQTYNDYLTIEDGTTTLLDNAAGSGTVNVSTTTGVVLIRFRTDGGTTYSGFTLHWTMTGLNTACANPITNFDTTAVTTTTVSLKWSAVNPAGPFVVVCGDQTFTGITDTVYTLTGLNPSTSYAVSVVDAASVDNRCCASQIIARTACGNASLPYSEGFEGMAEESFPSCWLQVRNFDEENYLPQVVSTHHSSGSRSLLLSCGPSDGAEHFGIVATPPLEGIGSHTVRLMLRASHSGLCVQFGTCDSSGSEYNQYGFVAEQTFYVYNTTEWQEYNFTWTPTSNGRRLALRMQQSQQSGAGRRLYIDDMSVENCGVDSVRAMHVEFDRLQLLWSTYGNPTCNVGVRVEGAVTDMQTFTNATSPLTITGLNAETRYIFTVYPTCSATPSISRSTTLRTPAMPVAANGFCSNFNQGAGLPSNWKFHIQGGCNGYFQRSDRSIYFYEGCGGGDAIMASERLTGLAGCQIEVAFSGYDGYTGAYPYGAKLVLGTMVHADDPSTFVPLDSVYTNERRQTFVATVPANSTGRHIAIRFKDQNGWTWMQFYVYGVSCSVKAVDNFVVEHRRGTSMVLSWAQPYDTVLVQYGPQNFALGTGTVDTFYNVSRGTITGLTPSTNYDLFVYRASQTPCEDMRYTRRTATQDYPLPYCEDFAMLNSNAWNSYSGDWRNIYSNNGRPSFDSHPYYGLAGREMTMSSWGYDWGYYSMAMLPDVEVDSNTVMSFYIYDQAPQSTIVVGTISDDYYSTSEFMVLDTIHISAYNHRVHYSYAFRPSDTLFNNRIVLQYLHPYQYSYYNCYIDELQFTHPSYGTLQNTYTSFDTVAFNLTSLGDADSVEITLVGGGQTFVDTVLLANIHNFGIGGLDTGTLYQCYVRPLDEGCNSLAGYIVTPSLGSISGYGSCYPFSYELSYELPYRWAADSATLITTGDNLQLKPHGSVAMHPMVGVDDHSFTFRARSHTAGDTLVLGSIPGDSISVDSTHFGPQIAYFSPIDTFVLGTDWNYYMLRLPASLTGRVRLTFRAGNDTAELDEVEITGCPIVHFEVDGNSINCTLDNDQVTNYYLVLDDSTGIDHRVIYVESNPYRISGLEMNMRYDLSWYCPFGESACRPTVSVHTGNRFPLPYCEDFDAATGALMTVPSTWTFIKNNNNDYINLVTDGPSLSIQPYYNNRWTYIVLPEFDVDSTLSLHAYIHTWSSGAMQIGVMTDATDTSTFIPLWTSTGTGWQYPEVELSGHTDKRVAIRVRYQTYLRRLHLYGYPLAKYSLIASRLIKVTTEYEGPYWLHYRTTSSYNTDQDTMFYVDTTVFYIHDTNITTNNYVYIYQTDSVGNTCENDKSYYLGNYYNLPYCYNHGPNTGCYDFYSFGYAANGHSYPTECHWREEEHIYVPRFYGNSSSWMVLRDMNIDSVQQAGMRVYYEAGSIFDTVVVGVMVDAYDTSTFTPLDTLVYTIGDSLQWAYVDFTQYADTGRWVAFHHLYTPNSQWFDFRYLYLDRCPGSLSAEASLSRWNRVKIDGKQVPFYVEYGYANYGQGSGANTILRVDSVPLILTLDPETYYDFYFRCDSLGYTCVPKQQVVTLAAPMDLPTCVDFDTVAATLIPHNWTSRNPGIGATNAEAHSDTNSLVMPVASNSYVITPDIDVDSIDKVALSLWYKVEDLSDRLVVGVMSNPADLSTFYPVRTLAPVEVGVWQRGMVEFGTAPADAHFIALRARSNRQAGGRNIYVDDIYVTDCAAFDFTVQRLTSNSIDLTWSNLGNPDVTVSVVDDSVVTATYTNVTPPLHIEPLDMLHYYTFRFNSSCDSTDTGYCSTNYVDSLSVVTPAPGTGCVNPTDLASPQAVFFSGSYRNPYSQAGAINYGSLHPDSRHTVCYDTAQRDPRTGNLLRTIPEGYTSSVRLGNWSTNYYTPEAEGVIYSLLVDTNSFELLLLRYAAVLQDPQHASEDQPRFRMELLDTNYNIIDSACTSADFIANQNLGWHMAEDGVLWKDWTAVGVDLSAHAGEQVYFRLTTFDCNEGSHYGYAYFTLECMRKNMNTVMCGDIDSNTLSAPEGFHYRWYTSQSNATVSTAQSITVPSQDITYYCDVSKLDNPSCHFLISAYGGTRYPMASFDTSLVIDSCIFHVTFTNTSGISNDGVNPLPGEHCETAYWDFGNGTTSSNYHGYAVYTLPGTYTVRLISGIALDECQDTIEVDLVLDLPPGMAPSDTVVASICDNQSFLYYNEPYTTAGTHYHSVPIPNSTCDSINVLMLDVRPTSVTDTTAVVCDSIVWHGGTYTASDDSLTALIGPNSVNCDSTLRLALTVNYSAETNDSIYICPGYPFLYMGVDYGGPTMFDAMLSTRQNCDSLVHVYLIARDSNYRLLPLYRFDSADWQAPDSVLKSCDPTVLDLRDSTIGAVAWNWNLFMADTLQGSTDSLFTIAFERGQESMKGFVSLIVTDTLGCFDTLGWPLFVFQSPVPEFQVHPDVPAMHNPEAQFVNLTWPGEASALSTAASNDSLDYLWRIQQQVGGAFDTTTEVNPFYHWGEEGDNMVGDYTVRLTAAWTHIVDPFRVDTVQWIDSTLRNTMLYETFMHTCIDSVEHIVTITNDYLQFPNMVSPNGDGINDTWVIVNLIEFGNYSLNELWIYDRTGAQVYHVKNIRRADQFWDPNATRSPDGTYYYRFTAKGEYGLVKRNGLIEVLR
ncbi:MAG: gliding motility-associated C-terminal domain-containing protein [Bacteroidales bacterium]|nr:gliding motility-associated C-terminal domain-containing protein [Bacteroidales bacterium]